MSLFLEALAGKQIDETPIWLMRQAGRYLPEYRALRSQHSMLEMVQTPELACEVTLQPLRRFKLDAGIIFADILTPLIGMGADLDFKKGEGPVIENPVRSAKDIEALVTPVPEEYVGYTLDAIKLVVSELHGRVPLIGFCGAPFTLASYLIEGQSPKDLRYTKALMTGDQRAWHSLQSKLTKLSADYLIAQVESGCQALQIFDSWLGGIGPAEYEVFVEPYLKELVSRVKEKVDVPIIFFATGVASLFPRLSKLSVDAFGVDWRLSLPQARELLGRDVALQGNLDPQILTGSWEYVERSVGRILQEGSEVSSHIFNVGHGIVPHTPVENVERLVELVKEKR